MAERTRNRQEWERMVDEKCSVLASRARDLAEHLEALISLPDRISRQQLLLGLTTRNGKPDPEVAERLRALEKGVAEAASRSSALRSALSAALGGVRALLSEVSDALEGGESAFSKLGRRLKGEKYRWELESARKAWDDERRFFQGLRSRLSSAETDARAQAEKAEKHYAWMAAATRGMGGRLPGDTTEVKDGSRQGTAPGAPLGLPLVRPSEGVLAGHGAPGGEPIGSPPGTAFGGPAGGPLGPVQSPGPRQVSLPGTVGSGGRKP